MDKLNFDRVKYIIIHCTDTRCDSSIDVARVRQWHLNKGFDDIGYHYLIKPSGFVEIGRDITFVGAHCLGYNSKSIGIAYVGGRDMFGVAKDTRTYNQKIALAYLIMQLVRQFPSIEFIRGHNDFSTKTCPCFDAKFEYRDFIQKVRVNIN